MEQSRNSYLGLPHEVPGGSVRERYLADLQQRRDNGEYVDPVLWLLHGPSELPDGVYAHMGLSSFRVENGVVTDCTYTIVAPSPDVSTDIMTMVREGWGPGE